jgi:hypothetical protein
LARGSEGRSPFASKRTAFLFASRTLRKSASARRSKPAFVPRAAAHRGLILDCPSDCSYLQQARGYDRFQPELFEDERWFSHVQIDKDLLDAHPVLLQILVESITQSASANSSLRDREVIDALTALVRIFETRADSGLHYELRPLSLPQQAMMKELREVIADYDGREPGDGRTPSARQRSLKALVFILRLALDRSYGPHSRADSCSSSAQSSRKTAATPRLALSCRNHRPTRLHRFPRFRSDRTGRPI